MIRAGIPGKVVINISVHKTRAVFDRYNMMNEEDLRKASEKVLKLYQETNEKIEKAQKIKHSHNLGTITVL